MDGLVVWVFGVAGLYFGDGISDSFVLLFGFGWLLSCLDLAFVWVGLLAQFGCRAYVCLCWYLLVVGFLIWLVDCCLDGLFVVVLTLLVGLGLCCFAAFG